MITKERVLYYIEARKADGKFSGFPANFTAEDIKEIRNDSVIIGPYEFINTLENMNLKELMEVKKYIESAEDSCRKFMHELKKMLEECKDLGEEFKKSPKCENCEFKPYGNIYCDQAMELDQCPIGRRSRLEKVDKFRRERDRQNEDSKN